MPSGPPHCRCARPSAQALSNQTLCAGLFWLPPFLTVPRSSYSYYKFVGFVDDLNKVGDLLGKAQAMQQSALGKLSLGKGNLVRRVDELRKLSVTPSKQLPAALLSLDLDDPSVDEISDDVSDESDR